MTPKNFVISVNKVPGKVLVQDAEGFLLPQEIEFEKDRYCKVFTQPEYRKLVTGLPAAAQRLYLWLIYEAEPGKDYIWINRRRFMKEAGLRSVNSVKKAIADLERYEFIAETKEERGVYWLNPRLFFCGSRIKKYNGAAPAP